MRWLLDRYKPGEAYSEQTDLVQETMRHLDLSIIDCEAYVKKLLEREIL